MFAGSLVPGDGRSRVDYWLRRCEGFRVDSPDGRVGVVEEVRYLSRSDRPDVIVVRAGLLGRLLLLVPVEEITRIAPSEERILLRRSPRPNGTERMRRLRRRGEGLAARLGLEARKEVKAVIDRLRHLIGPRFRRGGEREMTPEAEAPAEPPAEEPSAEAGEEPATEEAPAEAATEAAPAEEPAAEEPPAEAGPAEEERTV